jgi:outer membrane immunogenic protein
MRVLKIMALLQLGIVALAGPSNADGEPVETSRLSYAPAKWSGLFVGIQGGGAWADTGWTFPVDSYFTLPDGNRSMSTDPSGGVVGGHVTLNHQIGAYVIGAELALNGTFMDGVRTGPFSSLFPNDRFETEIQNYGRLTARLGYAIGDLLLYVDGGYAAGHVKLTAVSGPPGAGVIGTIDQRLDGWTAGGGVEWMVAQNVALGIQYDFVRLSGETSSTQTTGTPSNDPFIISSHDIEFHAVTGRLSIKLDTPAAPAVAVK